MKITQEEINRIQDLAIKYFRDLPMHLSWKSHYGHVTEKERRAVAYTMAVLTVLNIENDFQIYKEHGEGYIKL